MLTASLSLWRCLLVRQWWVAEDDDESSGRQPGWGVGKVGGWLLTAGSFGVRLPDVAAGVRPRPPSSPQQA